MNEQPEQAKGWQGLRRVGDVHAETRQAVAHLMLHVVCEAHREVRRVVAIQSVKAHKPDKAYQAD